MLAEVLLGFRPIGMSMARQKNGEHRRSILDGQQEYAFVSGLGEIPDRWSVFCSRRDVANGTSPRPGAAFAVAVDSLTGSRRSESGWERRGGSSTRVHVHASVRPWLVPATSAFAEKQRHLGKHPAFRRFALVRDRRQFVDGARRCEPG